MPSVTWEQLEEFRHGLHRLKQYYAQTLLREKVFWDSLKELEAALDKFIEETPDE